MFNTTAKLCGKRFGMWVIGHSLRNDFNDVSEWEKKFETKNHPASF